eukprot:1033875-Rhodomonas_salina.7
MNSSTTSIMNSKAITETKEEYLQPSELQTTAVPSHSEGQRGGRGVREDGGRRAEKGAEEGGRGRN